MDIQVLLIAALREPEGLERLARWLKINTDGMSPQQIAIEISIHIRYWK